jgi:1-phosphofructokinase family hexose kinase
MILTVTPNVALDVTYRVAELVPETSVRVLEVEQRAGGKGVNVARVLQALGTPVTVTGLAGGTTGDLVRADLAASGLADELVGIDGETRRTVAVVDAGGRVTILLEPGPEVEPEAWARLLDRFDALAGAATVAVVSGSLPRGVPADACALLVARGRARGCEVIVDTSGEPLATALGARPALVKPNRDELYAVTGGGGPVPGGATDLDDVAARAGRLHAMGAAAVVVSLGPDGMLAVTAAGAWHAALGPGTTVAGNPTGAGDAAVAALARGLAAGDPWPERLRDAVALSAAAVLHPLAGGFDAGAYARLRDRVQVRELARPAGA